MSGDGIIEVDGCLIDASRVMYVEPSDDNCNDLSVTVDGMDCDLTIHDCTLSRFREEWVRAKKY